MLRRAEGVCFWRLFVRERLAASGLEPRRLELEITESAAFGDPERFAPERTAGRHRFAYYPFGGGPRLCIGNTFATVEAQLVLASVAQRYRLVLVPGHPIALQPLITLRPKYGMRMIVERRETSIANVRNETRSGAECRS